MLIDILPALKREAFSLILRNVLPTVETEQSDTAAYISTDEP